MPPGNFQQVSVILYVDICLSDPDEHLHVSMLQLLFQVDTECIQVGPVNCHQWRRQALTTAFNGARTKGGLPHYFRCKYSIHRKRCVKVQHTGIEGNQNHKQTYNETYTPCTNSSAPIKTQLIHVFIKGDTPTTHLGRRSARNLFLGPNRRNRYSVLQSHLTTPDCLYNRGSPLHGPVTSARTRLTSYTYKAVYCSQNCYGY